MPARDIYHRTVREALLKDGWAITHDPLRLRWRATDTYVDLGAERLVAATKGNEEVAIEIKSFLGRSVVDDLENAVGQFLLYEELLQRLEPSRTLFLAITDEVYQNTFIEGLGSIFLESRRVRLLVFNPSTEEIVTWIQ